MVIAIKKVSEKDDVFSHINAKEITQKDIKEATTVDLLALYNEIVQGSLKKFENREVAEKRTWLVVQQLATDQKAAKKESPKKAEAKKKAPSKRAEYESRTIKVLIAENPKRPETRAFEKFAILMKFDGKSVSDYKAQEGKNSKIDKDEKGWTSTEIRWALKQGWIKLVNGNS